VSLVFFRIMVPVIVVVKILEEAGAVSLLGDALAPAMRLLGLPGSMGLVWAAAMVTNLYGGIVTFVSLAPAEHLSTAQVTVLATMMLVAHSLPVEIGVARQAGARVRFMLPFRIAGAFVLGLGLNALFGWTGMLGEPAAILWRQSAPGAGGLGGWALGQLRNLLTIYCIITVLIALMKILERTGLARTIENVLGPVLESLGIGRAASTVTIFGMILGLSYGGGLIIRAARSGTAGPRDVFFSLALMGLAHSVIEDSLLMMSLGASAVGVLAARMLFAWVVLFLLVRTIGRMPGERFYRLFCRPA
jgi:hypothetical protein